MTLQQLYYAITISETGSMNKAAEKLYIAQPSLSISMQELEKNWELQYLIGEGVALPLLPTEPILFCMPIRYTVNTTIFLKNSEKAAR